MTYKSADHFFLGLDLSTQQLKIIVTNESLKALQTYHVEFDKEYKQKYGILKGVLVGNDGEITSPVQMWLEALDNVLSQMKDDGFPFSQVVGISGSGMQHGSVFWSSQASDALAQMNPELSLAENLKDAFALSTSPNWQDHSTGKEMKQFEEVTGGPDKLAERTGSRAHFRFTGLQIRKLATRSDPKAYKASKRISLVSSFLASVFIGKISGIEEADACGMNLYDLSKREFDDELLAVAAGVHPTLDGASRTEQKEGVEELKRKLGSVVPVGYESIGCISKYFCGKYGFLPKTKIYSFTGDNLATIISLPLEENDVLVSLGTSTTVLLVTEQCETSSQYHLFKHPTLASAYMGMICYCNGSLAREKVRDELNEKHGYEKDSWDKFNQLLDESKTFDRKLGIYFPLGEIVPSAAAQYKRAQLKGNVVETVESWDVEEDVTSIVESQTISCRMRAGPLLCGSNDSVKESSDAQLKELYDDLHNRFGDIYTDGKQQTFGSLTSRPRNIFYVGGASKNRSIINKMSSIFGATGGNYQIEIPNACALGGAYKASWSDHCEQEESLVDFNEYLRLFSAFDNLEKLNVNDHWSDYFPAMGMLAKMESELDH